MPIDLSKVFDVLTALSAIGIVVCIGISIYLHFKRREKKMISRKNKILALVLSFIVGVDLGQGINIYFLFDSIPQGHVSSLFIVFEIMIIMLAGVYVYWIRDVLKGKYSI